MLSLSLSPPAGDAVVVVASRSLPLPCATATRLCITLAAWACLSVTVAAAQTLPYIPTSIFIPAPKPGVAEGNATGEVAYIFSPRHDSVDLLSLDISAALIASSLSLKTLSSGLPFLEGDGTAFVPSLADNGSLLVYAGNCSTSSGSTIWSFDPSTSDIGSTAWNQEDIKLATNAKSLTIGPGFLGASFSFSTMLEPETSPADTFVYGGMCPNLDTDTTSSSQSQATYSNQMVKVSMAQSSGYTVEPVQSSGPPVPEAGFTFTGLAPSFSNRSGITTQQINYVLLGGHTQYAFINMSTVAIWSLPQESWSFVSDVYMTGSGSSSKELALKTTAESVDSRSGHTAVLNEDGTALIVYGGWVGDLTQAAYPQLAVLQIGSEYGGEGEWQWSIPDSQPSGNGIYGHGAALLPGNVMMIYGGYAISSPSANKKRQTSDSAVSFLNLTSMTWSDDYTNPSYTGDPSEGSAPGLGSTQKQKLGLGIGLGLGLGLLFIALAVLIFFFCRKKKRNGRTVRDSHLRALAQDNSRFLGHDDLAGSYGQENDWYMGGPDPYQRGGRSLGYHSLQTGRASMDNSRRDWFGDMPPVPPPMTQINRKPVAPRAARGQHQPSSSAGYEPVPAQRGLGSMNPIFEADEDGSGDIGEEAMSPVRDGRRDSGAYSDPFLTPTRERPVSFPPPTRGSQTPSPEERARASVTDPDVQDWMTDVDAADALLSGRANAPRSTAATAGGPGRTSPSRRGFNIAGEDDSSRTESNISESNRSNLSRSGSLLRQLRPGFGVAVAAALAATTEERGGSSSSSSAPSYNTARSSFPALQAEGPGLLLGRDREREKEDLEDESPEPGSPSKNKPRRSWFGSLRRVFTGSDSTPSGDTDEESPFQPGVAETNDFEARLGGISGFAADGLLRRKGGRGAWESSEANPSQAAARYAPLQRGEGEHHDDEEWDIEKAVEKRLVQVMFTVPKEPLRVVNAEPDFESERDVVMVDSEEARTEDKPWISEQQQQQHNLSLPTTVERPISTPSPLSEEDKEETSGSKAEKEALRRELDEGWERIETSDVPAAVQPRTPPPAQSPRISPRTPGHEFPRRPPLLHYQQLTATTPPRIETELAPLTLEEQMNRLGVELQQVRSTAQTPVSVISHHSDADVLSAEAIRFERPSAGSTSTLQITPGLTTPSAVRIANTNTNNTKNTPTKSPFIPKPDTIPSSVKNPSTTAISKNTDPIKSTITKKDLTAATTTTITTTTTKSRPNSPHKLTDFRSESNLRAAGARGINTPNSNAPSTPRRVRAMVQEFESKSSRETSPAGSSISTKGGAPLRGSPSPSPTRVRGQGKGAIRGSPTRGAR